jgi:hypothetical protein
MTKSLKKFISKSWDKKCYASGEVFIPLKIKPQLFKSLKTFFVGIIYPFLVLIQKSVCSSRKVIDTLLFCF